MTRTKKDEVSFTITTRRDQRLRLEELRLRRARRDGGMPGSVKDLVTTALDEYLAREDRR